MTPPVDGLPSNYRFADLTLDVARRCVTRQGQTIELKALDFDLLRFLVEQAPNVVNADVLAEKVWGRHFVSPENVAQRVMLLRQSLSDDANKPRYIETVRNKGYRLIPVVDRVDTVAPAATPRRLPVAAIAASLLITVGVASAAAYWLAEPAEPTQRPSPSPTSIAVLPFENLSPNPDDAYFAIGMQDEIVSQLTKVSGLTVVPVREDEEDRPIKIGGDLDVATALGGSVYYSEGRVRVTPRLTDAATGVSLWSNSYERERSNIFAIQSEIAIAVARALRVELSAAERERIERVPTTNPQAQDLYLMARSRNPYSPREFSLGTAEIEQALTLDPEFKEAWVLYSQFRAAGQNTDLERREEYRLLREQAARQALALDPEFGAGYAQLAATLQNKGDWTGAEAAYRKAADLNVPIADFGRYGVLHMYAGNFSPYAQQIFEAARAATPQNETFHRLLAFTYAARGDWARANELYELGVRRFAADDETVAKFLNQKMHWLVGREDLASARAMSIDDPFNVAMLESLDAPEQALAELSRAYSAATQGNTSHSSDLATHLRDIALWAGHFGDAAFALDVLRAAGDQWSPQITYAWLPQLAEMRRLPEFKEYMREVGMVAYWQEYGWPPFCEPTDQHDFECH